MSSAFGKQTISRSKRIRGAIAAGIVVLLALFNLVSQVFVHEAFLEQQADFGAAEGQSIVSSGSPFESSEWQNFQHQIAGLHILLTVDSLLMIVAAFGLATWRFRVATIMALCATILFQAIASQIANVTRIEAVPRIIPILFWYLIVILPLAWPYFVRGKSPASIAA